MNYLSDRREGFVAIEKSLNGALKHKTEDVLLAAGDSLEVLKKLPNQSISLVLTDPPYHSTKKSNIANDKAFDTDEAFVDWMSKFSSEWKRILRPNGSIFLFCSSAMSAQLEVMMRGEFNILSHVVWTKPNEPGFDGWKGKMKKEALRQWYPHSERIIFAEPAVHGNLRRSSFGHFLREKRIQSGLSGHQLTELTGAYGKVNHGGAVSNWETGRNIPSREQYNKICEAIIGSGKVHEMPPYENVIRPFDVNSDVPFTDVWDFPSVRPYKGKHPAEKPIEMLEHCIRSTTFEGDIVLDCFAGSGSTAIASLNLGRKSIAVEIENKWVSMIKERLERYKPEYASHPTVRKHELMKVKNLKKLGQTTLFS